MLTDKVKKTIKRYGLLEHGDSVICAVSGGADSVCLLHVMLRLKKEYGLKVYAANVNHLIRGDEAERDSNFVKSICRAADTECFYREYDVPKIAAERKTGTEECGRILRYEFFEELSKKLGGAKIATGHNLNDNAETVLFRLVRGSAAGGLCGISYRRGNIIRPLLDCSRGEIEDYLVKNSVKWVTDSTNLEALYTRNRIRLEIMPLLETINSSASDKIVSAAHCISEDNAYLDECTEAMLERCIGSRGETDINMLLSAPLPIRRRAAKKILASLGAREITAEKVEAFLDFAAKEGGKRFDIDGTEYVRIERGKLVPEAAAEAEELNVPLCAGDTFEHDFWKIAIKVVDKSVKKGDNNIAVFDFDKVGGSFIVRYRRKGDRMRPFGLGGSKKINDILSDAAVAADKRGRTPIVEKDGEILFLCGLRRSELYAPDRGTKKYLIMEYSAKE